MPIRSRGEIFKDHVVTKEQWDRQRSWKRHVPDLSWMHVLRGNWFWVAYFMILPIFLNLYETVAVKQYGAPPWPPAGATPYLFQPFSITSFALALLITFRTNSCYARWWEARTIWGRIVNQTRNLARQSITWFPEEDKALLEQFNRWVQALGFILKCHLRQGEGLTADLEGILMPHEMELLVSWQFRPSLAGQVLSDIVQRAGLRDGQQIAMDFQIGAYVDDAGACDRIQKTCIPQSYTRHTSRFLIVFLTFLPFSLWEVTGWASPVVEAVIAFLFMGIDNIGIQIEEPFHVLPMDAYCSMMSKCAKEQYDNRKGLAMVLGAHRVFKVSSSKPESDAPARPLSPRSQSTGARAPARTQHRHSFQAPAPNSKYHSDSAHDCKEHLAAKNPKVLSRNPSCNV